MRERWRTLSLCGGCYCTYDYFSYKNSGIDERYGKVNNVITITFEFLCKTETFSLLLWSVLSFCKAYTKNNQQLLISVFFYYCFCSVCYSSKYRRDIDDREWNDDADDDKKWRTKNNTNLQIVVSFGWNFSRMERKKKLTVRFSLFFLVFFFV